MVGQYFRTKDVEEFSGFDGLVGRREYTLPRDESSEPRGWIRGNTKDWSCIGSGDHLPLRKIWC